MGVARGGSTGVAALEAILAEWLGGDGSDPVWVGKRSPKPPVGGSSPSTPAKPFADSASESYLILTLDWAPS